MSWLELDVYDMDLIENRIRLELTVRRTNRTVFIDDECSFILRRWLKIREGMNRTGSPALFLGQEGERLNRSGVYNLVVEAAERVGLYDARNEVFDLYNHIDLKELKEAYLAAIPQLGI